MIQELNALSVEEKLRIIISGAYVTEQGCLETNRDPNHKYPTIEHRGRKRTIASLLMEYAEYELKGHNALVMHTCDNKRCIYPAHLRVGTQIDNMRDLSAKHGYRGQRIGQQDAEDIRKMYREGYSQPAIAAQYGISRSYVSAIIVGRKQNSPSA